MTYLPEPLLSALCSDYDTRSTILTVICLWIHDLCIRSNVKPAAITDNNLLSTGGVGLEPAVLRVQTEIQETEYGASYVGFALVHL